MSLQVDFWQLISLMVGFLGFFGASGKLLLSLIGRMLQDRFDAQEEARKSAQTHWDAKFKSLEAAASKDTAQWQSVERELLQLKADLPIQYVRREDYIRNQSVIETKIDAVALRIENLQLKANANVRS